MQKGFTLIELMIVVAIIGILAAIAIPAYQDYTIRAKITEAVNAMAPAKTAVSEYYISQGSMPADPAAAGFVTAVNTQYVNSVNYVRLDDDNADLNVSIRDLGGNTADAQTITLDGQGGTSAVEWDCIPGNVGTAVDQRYLPADCRV